MANRTKGKLGKVSGYRARHSEGSLTGRFAYAIRAKMDELELDYIAVGLQCGISDRQIRRVVNAEQSTSLEKAELISEAVGLTLAEAVE
jgi:bacterioferritin-associated ferredoxin